MKQSKKTHNRDLYLKISLEWENNTVKTATENLASESKHKLQDTSTIRYPTGSEKYKGARIRRYIKT
jgi:hypothetical protein